MFRENQKSVLFLIYFSENCAVSDIMRKGMVDTGKGKVLPLQTLGYPVG
jgi:hypothetical protein